MQLCLSLYYLLYFVCLLWNTSLFNTSNLCYPGLILNSIEKINGQAAGLGAPFNCSTYPFPTATTSPTPHNVLIRNRIHVLGKRKSGTIVVFRHLLIDLF